MEETGASTPPRTCQMCPSFLSEAEASLPNTFGRSVGAPRCARFGYVLGKPGAKTAQTNALHRAMAKNCSGYGRTRPTTMEKHDTEVVFPDLNARKTEEDDPYRGASRVSSCGGCVNLIRSDVVQRELGWTAGLCAAKGRLIPSTREIQEAQNCEYRSVGPNRTSTDGLLLLPHYELAFKSGDLTKKYFAEKDKQFDPREYPTDAEVTEKEAAQGIRAWRKIVDPVGGEKFILAPIFDNDHFSPEERAKIPKTGDKEHPEQYIDHNGAVYKVFVLWFALDETPALWGMAGIGKTELFRHCAWLMQLPFERFQITGSSELDELAGRTHFSSETGTFFEYGRVSKAWTKKCVLDVDEYNIGMPDVQQFFRSMLDNSKQLVLDMNKGEPLDRNDYCFLGMTMNPAWDPRNVGANAIGEADGSRLLHIYMELPPEELEREILRNRVRVDGWEISDNQLDTIMGIARDVRSLSDATTISITWGIRPQIQVARALNWFDWISAYKIAAADYIEPEAREILLDAVRAHVVE